jgi:hypothetical protein
MQTALHAFSLSLQRLGIGLAIIVGGVMFALFTLVAVIVVRPLGSGSSRKPELLGLHRCLVMFAAILGWLARFAGARLRGVRHARRQASPECG